MARIAISVTGLHPYPNLVVALRRITGDSIGSIAAALSLGTPLLELDLQPAQFAKVRDLLALLRVAAVPPRVTLDGGPFEEQELLSMIEAWELALAQSSAGANGAQLA